MTKQSLALRRTASAVLLGLLLALGAGCGTAQHAPEHDAYEVSPARMNTISKAQRERSPEDVAPGYEVTLACPEDPTLNGKYRIEFDGTLKLPYKVKINTRGMTHEALQNAVVEAFSKFYKNPPVIELTLNTEHLWVEVKGLVEKPGRFLVQASTSMDEVLALAGGLQKVTVTPPKYVRILQGEKSTLISLTDYYAGSPESRIPPWEGGDIVFLQSDRGDEGILGEGQTDTVHVVGEVRNPGEYRFLRGADFYHYMVAAGGPTATSDMTKIELVRDTRRGKYLTRFAFEEPKSAPTIQPGDLIVFMADKQSTFERVVPVVAGLVSILNTVLLLLLLHY